MDQTVSFWCRLKQSCVIGGAYGLKGWEVVGDKVLQRLWRKMVVTGRAEPSGGPGTSSHCFKWLAWRTVSHSSLSRELEQMICSFNARTKLEESYSTERS